MATEEPEFFASSMSSVSQYNGSDVGLAYDIVSIVSRIVCAPVVLTLLILVVCVYKVYKTTLQRLILYHIIITLLCELSMLPFIVLRFYFQAETCKVFMYLRYYILISWTIYTAAVTNCLFIFTLQLLRGSQGVWHHGKVAECVCICLAIIAPMANIWASISEDPFSSTVCKAKDHVLEHFKSETMISTVYLIMDVEVLFVIVAMCSLFCFLRQRFQNRQLTSLLKRLLYYAMTNTAIFVVSAFFTVNSYLHHYTKPFSLAINVLSGIGFPFAILVSTILLSLIAIRPKICNLKLCGDLCSYCKDDHRRQQVVENVNETQGATNPTSHPLNQPSHTYFSIPYTGAFTQVTVNEHNEEEGERTPLI